ncbi:MAG: hypothetical protein WCI91_00655 [Candidatus Nomurabacteria bacterium]
MSGVDNKIEDIKRHLYDPVDTVAHRIKEGTLHNINHKVDPEWGGGSESEGSNNMKKPKASIFKKFFIFSIIFFIIAIGVAFYIYSNNTTSISSDNIDITVIGNAFVKGGEELPLQIEISNRNKANLQYANLMVSYPNGASDNPADFVHMPRISIGTIKPGETITKNIKVTLFGDERSDRNITIDLEYHPESSNAISTKEKIYTVNISSAPLSLFIDAPDSVATDQPISFNVKAVLNTSLQGNGTVMQVTYPNNFIYESAIPAPSFGNSMWSLDGLSLTNPISVVIKGRIVGQDKDQQVFHVYAGTTKPTDKSTMDLVYNSLLHSVSIIKPFIEANISVNDTAQPGDSIPVKIFWANNLSTKIIDGEIIVNLSGNAYDKMSVTPAQGFFDSLNNRIIWDKNSISELSDIEPGQTGEIDFSVKSTSMIGTKNTIVDPQIVFDVSIKGHQPSLGQTYTDVDNFSKKIVKILSSFQIATSASYKSGPLPPKAETKTDYTVNWSLFNGTNPISEAVARAALPIYVDYAGSNSPKENIIYNEATREVIWNIGSVRANTGGTDNREASFNITLSSSLSQVGSTPQLMQELFLSGTDSFTGTKLNDRRASLNTRSTGSDSSLPGFDRVVE